MSTATPVDHRLVTDLDKTTIRPAPVILRRVVSRPGTDGWDAYRINLSAVLDYLDDEDLEHFLIRNSVGERPVVGVTEPAARALLSHLHTGPGLGSIYAYSPGSRRLRLGRRLSKRNQAAMARVGFWVLTHLHDSTTGRRFGQEYACEVQVWSEEGEDLISRKRTPFRAGTILAQNRETPGSVEVYGRSARSYAPFDSPAIFEVDFAVDAVYLWVDGSDPSWRERKMRRLGEAGPDVAEEARDESRYRQFDELRYSLRSLERYAPWVRNVYLVTDQQRPTWLDETATNLAVVDHSEILPPTALPTYNSHALTARLHHIPGLSDHFLLFNDDILLGKPVPPERFFQANGVAKFFQSRTRITPEPKLAHEHARLRSRDLIEAVTGLRPTHVMKHVPVALNRQLLADLETELATEWEATVHHPFRSPTDIVPGYFHHYIGYARRLTTLADLTYRYFDFPSDEAMEAIFRYERGMPVEVVCVNDNGGAADILADREDRLVSTLERLYPHRSTYERPE